MDQHPSPHHPTYTMAARLISLVIIVLIMYCLQSILVPLIFSMLIAIILFPMARRMEMWRIPRLLSSIISVIIAIIVISGIIYLIVNQVLNIGKSGEDMLVKFRGILATILTWANTQFGITDDMVSDKFQIGRAHV